MLKIPDNTRLTVIDCPSCRGNIDIQRHGDSVACTHCGLKVLLNGRYCLHCGAYDEGAESLCFVCQEPLQEHCQQCGHGNWVGSEYCHGCAAPLGVGQTIERALPQATQRRLTQRQAEVGAIKRLEADASQRRLNQLLELEDLRLQELQLSKERLEARESRILRQLLLGLALFVVLLIVAAFYLAAV